MGKILVAEDSIIVNQHIKFTLEKGGHEVVSAYTGKEAISLAEKINPDLILMDIMMETSTDGLDAALKVKETLDIPIIFLTALTDDPTIQKAKFSLPHGYVVKPFNEAELLSNIDVAIYKAEAERKIKENSELFQIIINSINQLIFLVDVDWNIKYTNTIAETVLDKKFDVLVNKPIKDFLRITKSTSEIDDAYYFDFSMDDEFEINDFPSVFGDFKKIKVNLGSDHFLIVFSEITDRVRAKEAKENLKKRQLSSLIEGQEKERERIARDLHDGVGQIANLIKLESKRLDENPSLIELIDHFLEELRKTTNDLLPSRLKDFPLEVCLKKLIDQANERSEISFYFNTDDIPEMNMTRKVNLYRIVQECISNILKHSKADSATIQFFGFKDHMQITFEDDGIGFNIDEKRKATHHGLQNIIFRSEVMNASCHIESKEDEGSFISIKIPIEK